MNKLWAKFFGGGCEHQHTLTVRSVGVERTVCEDCGNVSFVIAPNLTHDLVPHDHYELEYPKAAGL